MTLSEPGRPARQYRLILWGIWLTAGLLMGLAAWQASQLSREDYQRQLAGAERDLGNLTRVSQEHAIRTLRSADQVVNFVRARYLELGNQLDLAALTRQGVIDADIFNQVGIIDARGIYVLANMPTNGLLDLSDREHFRVHMGADTGELFVSKPVVGRATGKWSIQLTRRISHPDGSFAGVVVLSVDPRYFTRFYGELKLGSQGVVALYGLDGVGRARRVGQLEEFARPATGSMMFERLAQGDLEGSFTERSKVDAVERLYFFRRLTGYPMVAVAGMGIDEMLANHQRTRDDLYQQAALLMLLIAVLALALTRVIANWQAVLQARLAAQREAQAHSEQMAAIFALSPDGFISFNQAHCVAYVNPAFHHLVGAESAPLNGMDEATFSDWLAQRCQPGHGFAGLAALRQRASTGQAEVREQITVLTPSPRILQLGLRSTQVGAVSYIVYFRDVSVETAIDTMKSEFLATAAHELRTPMTSILGFTEVLLTQEHDADAQREFLGIVLAQSQLMAHILDDLLDLARIEARRGQDFRYTLVDLGQLASDTCKALRVPDGRAPPALLLGDTPVQVMADRHKMRQALMNVLTNAYKYSGIRPDSAVSVQVSLSVGPGASPMACLSVTDHGVGMTAEQCSRVFERFYRADTSGKVQGTGLGMSIVKDILDLHHGHIDINSTPGEGTRVRLCLPAHAGQT